MLCQHKITGIGENNVYIAFEYDGSYHNDKKTQNADKRKDLVGKMMNIQIIRIDCKTFNSLEKISSKIYDSYTKLSGIYDNKLEMIDRNNYDSLVKKICDEYDGIFTMKSGMLYNVMIQPIEIINKQTKLYDLSLVFNESYKAYINEKSIVNSIVNPSVSTQ